MKQWKRLAALSSAIVMAMATLTYFPSDTLQNIRLELSASAETTTEPQVWIEDNLTWKLDADGTLTISGTGAMKDYNAAENLSPAYMNSNIKKVVIEKGVTRIGELAFFKCSSLTNITIPDSVTCIAYAAFGGCTNLTDITIPDSVTSIGMEVFLGCNSLTSITIPNGITSIGDDMFSNCWSLTSITIPDSVTSIGMYAFSECSSLTSITIPKSVTSIGNSAFRSCNNLTVYLENGSTLTSNDLGVDESKIVSYWNEDNLTWTLTADGTLTISGTGAMKGYNNNYNPSPACGNSSVKKVVIEDGVTSIGYNAFYGCSTLTGITIPDSVTSIGGTAFQYCSSLSSITIPNSVTSIGSYAFSGCGLTSITIPDSVTSIGSHAFYDCSSLTSITIPNSVTSIGEGAFHYCSSLTSITIPDSVTNIEDYAFYKCSSLTSITIPDSVTSIGDGAFKNCSGLTSITIPKSVTSIGDSAFDGCTNLTVYLENGSTLTSNDLGVDESKIVSYHRWNEDNLTWKLDADGTLTISGTGAMKDYNADDNPSPAYNNSKIKKIVIEDGVTSIGKYAFDSCSNLTSITIPGNVKSIGECAFYYCNNLTDVTLQDGVKSIGDSAFIWCNNLTNIVLPNSITSIEFYAFKDCTSLTSIKIPSSVTSMDRKAFYNCSSLKTISLDCKSTLKKSDFGDQADLVSYTNQHILTKTEAKTATCTEDGNKEYWTCEHCGKYFLSDDSNPETAKAVELSETVISASHKLTKVEAKDATCAKDGNKEYWTCEHCGKYFLSDDANPETAKAVELSETVIPALNHKNATTRGAFEPTETKPGYSGDRYCPDCDTVLKKGYTYWNEGNLTWKLDAKGTLTISGTGAMKDYDSDSNPSPVSNNLNVEKIVIEDGVTSIGIRAFNACRNLTNITIPDNVTSIGDSAFHYCENLTSVTIPNSVTSIGDFAFYNCRSLTSITIPDRVTSIGNAAFEGCKGLTSITIPDSITSIGDFAFSNCSDLTSITIPDRVTSIGNAAFRGCTSLTSITIPDSVTSIGNSAFFGCSRLTSITISNNITIIKNSTFLNCSSLTSITIPDSVTSIGGSAFYNCSGLTSITIPSSVTSIGKWAFDKCSSLTSITIPDSVTSIEDSAFKGCSSLTAISLSCKSSLKKSDFGEQADLVSYTNQHLLTKTAAKDATCSEDGNKEYWTCEHCKKYFLSDDTNPETAKAVEQSETVIPALKHKNATTRGAVKPTETEPGYFGDRYCPDCDTVLEKGYTYWVEDNLTWKLYEDGTLTISGTGAMKDYNDIDNLSPAYCNSKVKKVVIEDGVTSIGDSAFESCNTLISITIPDGVTSIGEYAFCNCTSLTSITIPDGVTSIEEHAFYGCNSLTSITIPGNVTSIENGMFYNCSSLTDIVIPNSVTSIGYAAFYGCNSLTSITIPGSVTSIGYAAFNSCGSLTSITIPDSVTSIGYAAFNSCGSLTSITIPDSVTSIGRYAFQNCSSLTSVTIPDSVTSIGDFAFSDCTSLTAISLSCKSSLKRSDFGDQADLVSYTSHTLKKTEAKDATCAEDGNKEYWTCEHCKKYFLSDDTNPETAKAVEQAETVIPASHKLTKVEAKDATCTEDGNIEYWTCEHCKKYFLSDDSNPETAKVVELSETVIPASHKLTKVEAKAATCTENGNKEYWTCEHCGKYFLSDDSNPETAKTVELSETVIPALVQVATTITPIKCVYGQDMSKIDLRDYVKNTDVVGEVTVKVATDSTLPDGIKLDGSKLSGKPAKAYEDSKEVTFTFTAENGSTANLTLLFLVEKADPTVEVAVSGDSHTEGDLVSELKLILSENSTKGVVEIVSEIKALAAGKNTFTWKFTPEDENNYNMVTGTVVVNAQTTTTTTTTVTTTTTSKATTTTKPNKTTTTKATTTTKPSKATTTNATTTTKPSKTTTTKATTTTKPNKTTTTKATTTTKPSKTTTTKATTTTKPSKTTTTNATTTTKPSKTTTTNATTTTKPNKTTTTNATTTTKPSKTTTTNATTTTKPSKTTTTNATTTTKPSKTTTTNATTTTKPSKTTTTNATTTTKPSKTTTTNATTTTKPSKTTTTNATTTTKPSKTTTTNATTTTKPSKTTTTKATTTNTAIPSYGDVNLDGKVDILDAVFLNKYLATLIQFSDAQIANADCCQDGVLNDQDTTALVHFIILLIDDLPVQPTEK